MRKMSKIMKTCGNRVVLCFSLAVIVISLLAGCGQKQATEDAVVIFTMGDVQLQRGSDVIGVKVRDMLKDGDIVTTGANSCIVAQAGENLVFRIEADSRAELSAIAEFGNNEYRLDRGLLLLKVIKLKKAEYCTIKTPTTVASVRGTVFSVEHNEGFTNVAVSEGKVSVARASKTDETVIEAGSAAVVADTVARRDINAVEELKLRKIENMQLIENLNDAEDGALDNKVKEIRLQDEAIDKKMKKLLKDKMSLEEIKTEYGRIDMVRLYSGRVYRGVVVSRGKNIKMITPQGTINIEAKKIKETASR